MTEPYRKPALTFEAQLAKLTGNGLLIADAGAAAIKLSCISYYRLSAYSYPFRIRNAQGETRNQLVAGTTFERVLDLYDFPTLPLWMLTEVLSLGSLSRVYQGLKPDDKRLIADHFNLHHKRLSSWLHTLTYVRNVCAHHSRLWNRELAIRPDQTKDAEWSQPITPRNDRVFYILLMLKHLLSATGNGADWAAQVNGVLTPIASNRKWRAAMGVPDAWATHPIWTQ